MKPIQCSNCGSLEPHNYKNDWLKLPLRDGTFYLCSHRCQNEFSKLSSHERALTPEGRAIKKQEAQRLKLEQELKEFTETIEKLKAARRILIDDFPDFDNPDTVKQVYETMKELFESPCDCEDYDSDWYQ